jgi:hypothetical protein
MLPTHKLRQIPHKIFSCICDIFRRSHALHGTEGFYEISEVCADAIAIDARTFNCCGEDGIDGDELTMTKTSTKNWGATLLGRVLQVSKTDKQLLDTQSHFMGQQIYGIVKRLSIQ